MPADRYGRVPYTSAQLRIWCRNIIEHRCIYRSRPGQLELMGEHGRAAWQFYFPIALLNTAFAEHIALLFWEMFAAHYARRPFQLAACESGGMPLACAIQRVAYPVNDAVNVIESKKAAKSYGLGNWIEGVILPDVPVLLVDDVVGSKRTMRSHARRLQSFGLEVMGGFAVASCKHAPPLTIDPGDGVKLPLKVIYGPNEFTRSYAKYVAKYGREPQFQALI